MDVDAALAALATIDQLRLRAKQTLALAARVKDSEQSLGGDVAKAARQDYKPWTSTGQPMAWTA